MAEPYSAPARTDPPARLTYSSDMALYRLDPPGELESPTLVAAFDSWIDAGSASSTAAEHLAADGPVIAEFDGDRLFDFRARRPTLEIVDGRMAELTWPALVVRHRRIAGRDVLVMTGAGLVVLS